MTLKKDLLNTLKILIVATILSFGISVAYAQWAAPTSAPPAGNVSTPINTSTTAQIKTGALGVAAFTADSALFSGDVTVSGVIKGQGIESTHPNCGWSGWSSCTAWQTSDVVTCPSNRFVNGYQRQGCSVASCSDNTRCERVQLYCCN